MRRNRKDNTKKERIIMIASSVFVLTALTMTGVYMQSKERKSQNDGYTIDFSALENNVDDKAEEIAKNNESIADMTNHDEIPDGMTDQVSGLEDDLDYLPMEAGSGLVEIPGLTDGQNQMDSAEEEPKTLDLPETDTETGEEDPEQPAQETSKTPVQEPQNEPESLPETTENAGEATLPAEEQETLHFSADSGLIRPLQGELQVLIPFSMTSGVYFKTLDHYKRSDAMVIAAPEGTAVAACAEGKVVDIFQDAKLGHGVTMELGDGYQITYGQLRDITVAVGSYVNAGDIFAAVDKTTKYYVREGDNLYLRMTADGAAIDPSGLFQ